jgi:hypothetical protein
VTASPPRPSLPTTEVVPPKGLWQFVFKRLLLVAAIALVMVWAVGNTGRGMLEAVVVLALVILIAAVQVPLFQRRWRRLEELRLQSLPAGAIYAGPARAESLPGSEDGRPVPGELLFDATGLSFTPKQPARAKALRVKWTEMSHIRLNPISYAPLAGSLVITLPGGSTQSFVVQRCASLAEKLQHLPQQM